MGPDHRQPSETSGSPSRLRRRVVLICLAGVILVVGTLFAVSELRRDAAECMWPGRPDCQPVGTTLRVVEPWGDDGLCTRTRYHDEEGEAAFTEIGCP